MAIGIATIWTKMTTAKLTSRVSQSASPTTSLTGLSYSKDQPQSPSRRPLKTPSGFGQTPIQTRYCSHTGRSSPYWRIRNSAFAAEAASPCARSSAIWLVRKSPGGSLMMKNTSAEMIASVTAIVRTRRRRKRIIRFSRP